MENKWAEYEEAKKKLQEIEDPAEYQQAIKSLTDELEL